VAERQRLALVHDPRRFSILALAEAARGVCDLTWVVDTTVPETDSPLRQLRRFGTVVDVGGMSLEDAAASIAADHPNGILALADGSLMWTAEVAQLLGLRSVTAEVARRLSDKDAQRSALRDGGVSVPGFWQIPDGDDEDGWALLAREATFPAVLKPRRGEGGREVVPVRSLDHLRSLLAEPPPRSPPTQLMLEEYLPDRPRDERQAFADFVSVESIVSAGRVSHLAITGRFPLAEPFRETGSFIPSALEDDERDAVLSAASAAIVALGITTGCQHTEIKLTPDGPRVIEVNGRVGAGVPDMLGAVTDLDLLAIAMRIALGETIVFDELPRCGQVVFVLLRQAPASMRRIIAVEGLDQLRADPSVRRVILQRGPGQSVDWREGFWGHVFSVEGVVADHEQLKGLARRVDSEIQLRGE
jgi:Carbamoyl-phosphate synthase L chain, ATP binding domain